MDFVKKFAEEQFEKQMGGGQQGQGQQGQQGQGQSSGFGDLLGSFTGGGNGQQQQQQQQGSYGGNQGTPGSYGGGEQQSYGNNQQGGDFGVTGGAQYNAPHGSGGASSYGGGGGGGIPNLDQSTALAAANQHAGNGNENASLFSTAFSYINNMNKDDKDVDEDDVQRKHEEAYGQGQAGNMSANAIGSAAALQALKQYTSGNSGAAQGSTNQGSGDMMSKIIGMAISEAAKLFDKSGGAASGTKQDAMTSAGQTMMKLMLKNQVSGMIGGGQSSGGLGQLMGMASKFM